MEVKFILPIYYILVHWWCENLCSQGGGQSQLHLLSCASSSNSMAFRSSASSLLNSVGIGLPSIFRNTGLEKFRFWFMVKHIDI